MPATKIETGIYLELKRLKLLPNARKHRPDKIASLAASIKESNVQLQDMIVCPQDEPAGANSELFDILAGGGRWDAETSLGWEKGRCTIMYGLAPYEKLKVTLDENKEREETGPLDDARIYQSMKDADPSLTQEKLAEVLWMSQERLSEYISLAKQPVEVQEIIGYPINLGMDHLLQLCRLKTWADLVELTEKASSEGWSVKKLAAEVKNRLGKAASPSGSAVPLPKGEGSRRGDLGEAESQPFQFKLSGRDVLVSARIPLDRNIDPELAKLKAALIQWVQSRYSVKAPAAPAASAATVGPAVSAEPAKTADAAVTAVPAVTADAAVQAVTDLAKNILGGLF